MKRTFVSLLLVVASLTATAQLKPRPDAFPPVQETHDAKSVTMATTIDEMAAWDCYPTYPIYLEMMQRWVDSFPQLCHLDTIGTSVEGRLILSMYIEPQTDDDLYRPEFFYSSTIHGDEVTGYVMLLRLIDTLLHGYGSNQQYTDIVNRTRISINPLANPDGTYHRGDNTVQGSVRYNANNVDLNRNYPNPFSHAKAALQPENQAMIDYFSGHSFRLSANLHGGAEVMNYPWDSYTSSQLQHPAADWWVDVCRRFVDTSRTYDNNHFHDTYSCGYTAGGDWYVITGGRQDYFTYYGCLEMTMEISTQKTLSSNRLSEYWGFLQHSLVNYIEEIHSLPVEPNGIRSAQSSGGPLTLTPNPTFGEVVVEGLSSGSVVEIYDMVGHRVAVPVVADGSMVRLDLTGLPAGLYILRSGTSATKLVVSASAF